MDEWIRYHLHIGFHHIYIYDNSPEHSLRGWQDRYPGRVTIQHFPGDTMQLSAYNTFLWKNKYRHTWCAFIDADEFIVLKKHNNVVEMLQEHCPCGALTLNWVIFGSSGHKAYTNSPVRKRFTWREKQLNEHVKTIAHLPSTDAMHIHHALVSTGTLHDTKGNMVNGPFNMHKPDDVAVIHHYIVKSYEEYSWKARRGRADADIKRSMDHFHEFDRNEIQDSSAWDAYPH